MKALIGYDGTANANVAIDLAASLRWPEGSVLRIVTAIDPAKFETIFFPVGPQNVEELFDKEAGVAEERAAIAVHRLERDGITVEHAVVQGRPSRALAAEAASMAADLIIVGSRGRGGVASALLGSVSAETIDHATVPVLVARSAAVGRVLAADDGSDGAAHAIDCLRRWPLFADAAVDVVSVCRPPDPFWYHIRVGDPGRPIDDPVHSSPERREHFEIADRTATRLRRSGHPAEGIVEQGEPAERIVRTASQQRDDLIVLGTHRYAGVERLLQGSVSRSVLTHTKCSVLVVQPPRSS